MGLCFYQSQHREGFLRIIFSPTITVSLKYHRFFVITRLVTASTAPFTLSVEFDFLSHIPNGVPKKTEHGLLCDTVRPPDSTRGRNSSAGCALD